MTIGDPVVEKRQRMGRLATLGKRIGYGLFLLAIVVFFIGFFFGVNTVIANVVIWAMFVGSVFLLPAILLGYAVKAAEKEDLERARSLQTPPPRRP